MQKKTRVEMHKTFELKILQIFRVFINLICTLLSENFLFRP